MRANQQQAQTLKELGYDVPCRDYWYLGDTGTNTDRLSCTNVWDNWNMDSLCLSAPTLHEITDWLRDAKGLHIMLMMDTDGSSVKWCAHTQMNIDKRAGFAVITTHALRTSESDPYFSPIVYFETHDNALSAAIDRCLNLSE